MSKIDLQMTILPDIEMYGGDTTPWYIQLVHGSGIGFTYSEAAGYTSRLTITPYIGGGYAVQKTGTISSYGSGGAAAVFSFAENDTKTLFGKYVYQVEFINGSEKRIGQGTLVIRKNVA